MICEVTEMNDRDLVRGIFNIMKYDHESPAVVQCERIGVKKSADVRRPIRVTLRDPEIV